ncbi:hypothetical protein [uncultured Lactobacillus sp.]|uniref:hypothetical protein n=1 Tax=uncultured Lactobacillus sp. TaxID=153152 RepID=UPI00262C0909|nr:hypothetical protein [uncultured Lactobacillus sp.]
MRKNEIKAYVDNMITKPSTDATGMTAFEKTFSEEEWDYFMKLLWEKQRLYEEGKITVPEPLVG